MLVLFQALKADLVPYLLKLLEGIGLENLESPSATKAQIVKALKAMTRSLQHGEQVSLHRGLWPRGLDRDISAKGLDHKLPLHFCTGSSDRCGSASALKTKNGLSIAAS